MRAVLLPQTLLSCLTCIILIVYISRTWFYGSLSAQSPNDTQIQSRGTSLARDCQEDVVSEDNIATLPTYSGPGICSRIPRDRSANFLWNGNIDQIIRASFSNGMKGLKNHHLDDFIDIFEPNLLRRGTRTRPLHKIWGAFLAKLQRRLESLQARKVNVLVLSPLSHRSSSNLKSDTGGDTYATTLWQDVADRLLGKDIINITVDYSTTETYTHSIRHKMLNQIPDMILQTLSAMDMTLAKHSQDTLSSVRFQEQYRSVAQEFIRACLDWEPCSDLPPAIMLFDDYVGDTENSLTEERIQSRVLEQLADYYQLGFVAFSKTIQGLYHSQSSPSLLERADIRRIGIIWTLLYSFLSFTVDYCSHESTDQPSAMSFISKEIRNQVETIPPPFLDASLSLMNVSPRWKEEERRWRQHQTTICRDGTKANPKDQTKPQMSL